MIPRTAGNPIQDIEQFLLTLNRDYGFQTDVGRVMDCLSCSADITNLSEVLYRLQSMVCKNEQQIDVFQSLFAQHFLHSFIQYIASGAASSDKAEQLEQKLDELKKKVKNQEKNAQKNARRLEEAEKNVEELSNQLKAGQEQLNKQIEEREKQLKESRAVLAITPAAIAQNDEKLERQIDRMLRLVRSNEDKVKACTTSEWGKDKKSAVELSEEAKNSADGVTTMKELSAEILSEAEEERNNTAAFHALVTLARTIKQLADVYSSAVGSKTVTAVKSLRSAEKKIQNDYSGEKNRLKDIENELEHAQNLRKQAFNNAENSKKETERKKWELEQVKREIDDQINSSIRIKDKSHIHREIFTGKNARSVQTLDDAEKILNSPLPNMSSDQMHQVLSYIRTNARLFKEVIRRKTAVPEKRKIDMRRTVKAAARTDGEIISVKYKKPVKSHANIVCMADVSGSCRAASSLTLYFMAMMNQAFPNGCKKFAFVDHLVPVDKCFANCSPDDGVKAVNSTVQSKGVYSNYGKTIKTLREDYTGLFHHDTILLILGDARNNNNLSADKELKYIADRIKNVFWLNPDKPEKWNEGDSIVSVYEKAGAKFFYVATVNDLLNFMVKAGKDCAS